MSDDHRPWRNGELPKPPPGVTPAVAWQKGAIAELKASEAADRALDMFQQLGGLRTTLTQWSAAFEKRQAAVEKRLETIEAGQRELVQIVREKLPAIEGEAREARISSSDLSEHVQEIDVAIAKLPRIDSQRVKTMIDERYEAIVSKEKLEKYEKQEAELAAERKKRADEIRADKRARKTGIIVSVVGGVILAILTGVGTYIVTHAPSPNLGSPATVNAPSH